MLSFTEEHYKSLATKVMKELASFHSPYLHCTWERLPHSSDDNCKK